MSSRPEISIVIPCYKCAQSLPELCQRIKDALTKLSLSFEILFINDGSPEEDWAVICKLAEKDGRVYGINLSRNFGQHHAITAGLDHVRGEWVVVMDGDLQDRPEEIEHLYNTAKSGYDIVVGIRQNRQDSFLKRLSSKLYYCVYNYLSDSKFNSAIGNFGIYSRKVIESVQQMKEANRNFCLFAFWTGYRRIEIQIQHSARQYGKSSYTLYKLFSLAFSSAVAYSNKLLRLTVQIGVLLSLCSFVIVILFVFLRFVNPAIMPGWVSMIASIYLIGGVILSAVGVVGLYVEQVFNEVKKRPIYLIADYAGEFVDCNSYRTRGLSDD